MPIYERGDSYMVSVGSGKGRYRETFPNRREAEAAELREQLRRKEGRSKVKEGAPQEPLRKTLKDAFDLTVRVKWRGTKGSSTAEINGKQCLEALGEDTLLSDLTSSMVLEAIDEWEDRGNSGGTINRKLSALSTILKTAHEQDPPWVSKILKLPRRPEGAHRIRWMNEGEEAIVLAKCDALGLTDLKDFIIVAVDTGFRRGELLPFKLQDFSNGMLHLHAGATKNDDARSVPATKRVAEVIRRRGNFRLLFQGLTEHTLRWQWDILKRALGLQDDAQFVVHMLRHTCASRMVQRGVPLAVVQKWMGHKDITTTLRYAHLAPDSLQQARQALEGKPVTLPTPSYTAGPLTVDTNLCI